MRNRIINGNMMIDQRSNGASVTPATSAPTYTVDRFFVNLDTATTRTSQQSSTAPTGFIKSFLVTNTTGANAAAGDQNIIQQSIEGFNVADLGWGTASAQTITISFWVYSSLTGTYGVALTNSVANRCYVASYTINSASTWEQKTITIAGDTSGTWLTNNGIGIRLRFDLGSGTTLQSAAGSWSSTFANTVSGRANWIGTSGATFYITGVQLEKGSTATPFEQRLYTTELQLCQRYLPAWNTSVTNEPFGTGIAYSATGSNIFLAYQVQPRVSPTGITASAASSFYLLNATNGIAGSYATTTFYKGSLNGLNIVSTTSAGLVAGNGTLLATNTAGPAQILATGCEL
jgi:hypothetical protein